MGKTNFAQTHYRPACKELYDGAAPTVKISYFSDEYQAGSNFAIVIMYHWSGELSWFNEHKGHRGRFLYVAFQNTDWWTGDSFEAQGNGVVHNKMYKDTFGEEFTENKASCGGAGIKDGTLRFSSLYLNTKSSDNTMYKHKWEADGSKHMCNEERAIVEFATKMWKQNGKNTVHTVPTQLHEYLMGRGTGREISTAGVDMHSI